MIPFQRTGGIDPDQAVFYLQLVVVERSDGGGRLDHAPRIESGTVAWTYEKPPNPRSTGLHSRDGYRFATRR